MKPSLAARLRRVTDSFWGACFGAGVYAAWAVWANWEAGERVAYTAGLTHWLVSTFLTYTGTGVMRRCYARGRRAAEAAALSFGGGLAYTYALLFGAHLLTGTAHIALTLAAGVIPNILFCSSYTLLLSRTQPASAEAATDPEAPTPAAAMTAPITERSCS